MTHRYLDRRSAVQAHFQQKGGNTLEARYKMQRVKYLHLLQLPVLPLVSIIIASIRIAFDTWETLSTR